VKALLNFNQPTNRMICCCFCLYWMARDSCGICIANKYINL